MFVFAFLSVLSPLFSICFANAAPSGSSSNSSDFLNAHNSIRAVHNASALTWSTDFAAKAATWANACQLQLTGGKLSSIPYGELQVAASGSFPVSDAINTFIEDESSYNSTSPTLNHFTQIVWKSTTQVGCAVAQCKNILSAGGNSTTKLDGTYYVCLYTPPGNVIGEERDNVQV